MAAYTIQSPPHAGAILTETQPATGTGNTAPCGNGVGLLVKNGSGAGITVTIAVPATTTFDGLAIPNRSFAVAAGADGLIPLVAADYLDPATGLAAWGVSANTTVVAAVIAIGA